MIFIRFDKFEVFMLERASFDRSSSISIPMNFGKDCNTDDDADAADADAFAHYAVDWLEESAGTVLGVLPTREMALAEPEDDPRKVEIADEVDALLLARTKARTEKDWGKADEIRDTLQQMGVVVVDTAEGPTWDLA